MHFLSHYYTEHPEQHPLFVAGLGIPDLAPRFTRIYNSIIREKFSLEQQELKHIYKGIVQHYKADKKFHNSHLFLQHVQMMKEMFIEEKLDKNKLRLSVIAHIAVEMLIDRQIVLQKANVCEAFYARIEEADEQLLNNFFSSLSLHNEKEIYLSKFQFFKERKFLFLFSDLEKVVFGLNKVYSSATKTTFTMKEEGRITAALRNIDEGMRYSWQEILKA